jgi:PAS domain S-box-containing protein
MALIRTSPALETTSSPASATDTSHAHYPFNESMTNSPDGIWIISADASTLYASFAMCAILGAHQSDLMGKSSFDYLFPEDVGAAQRLFQSKAARRRRLPFTSGCEEKMARQSG